MRQDFVIADGLPRPGPLPRLQRRRAGHRRGRLVRRGRGEDLPRRRRRLPTICGTGLEDYVGSAWGLGAPQRALRRRAARSSGRNAARSTPTSSASTAGTSPTRSCSSATCGSRSSRSAPCSSRRPGATLAAYEQHQPGGGRAGWNLDAGPAMLAWGIAERVDDYCATAYVYCTEPATGPAARPRRCPGRHRTPRLRAAQSDRATERGRGPVQRLSQRGGSVHAATWA